MIHSPCSGPVGRREFLRAGTLALGGLTLPQLLAAREQAGNTSKPTSVILFWMWGGPSQLESWDPKPLAPSEYRGPLNTIPTKIPGLNICEIFPRFAQLADRMSFIRSVHHTMDAHNDGSIEMLTGKTPSKPDPTSTSISEHPDFGVVTSRCRGRSLDGMPQYVGIPRQPFMIRSAYLGASHAAYASGDPSVEKYQAPNLQIAAGMDGSRLGNRRELLTQFDNFRRDLDLHDTLNGTSEFQQHAFQILTSSRVAHAFDLSRESDSLRDKYGRHLWGQSCLLARRLAESGVAVITVDALAPLLSNSRYFSWDDHAIPDYKWDIAEAMKHRALYMEQAVGTLIEDLFERGLDQQVLLVAMGEFGRTPRYYDLKGYGGRNHWPQAQSIFMSGGGLKMGQVIGATNSKAEYPVVRPVTPQEVLATIYHHLGIDPRREFHDFQGRPIPILNDSAPISELL